MANKETEQKPDVATVESIVTRDVNLGNTYRVEYIKNLVSISTGVLVFSVTFMKELLPNPLTQVVGKPILIAGWSVMIISVIAGVFHMRFWAAYYISWGLRPKSPRGYQERAFLYRKITIAEYLQISGFLIGLVLLVTFASLVLLRRN